MAEISVVNVVGHLDLQREVELRALEELLATCDYVLRVKYEPAENHWLQTWFESPETGESRYVSFYRSGSGVLTGCSSEREFHSLADRVVDVLEPVVEDDVRRSVKNIVAASEVGDSIDLSIVALNLGLENVEYEPEQFPGLIVRDPDRGCAFLLFANGKLICTGLTELSALDPAVNAFVSDVSTAARSISVDLAE